MQRKTEWTVLRIRGFDFTYAELNVLQPYNYSRREILEIIVLPKSLINGEAESRMCQICQSLDYNVNKEHLVACYWLKDTERVIVKFCQRKGCEKVLKAKNELRELSKTNLDLGEGSEIFFNQNVCSCYHSFWSRSKKLDSKGKILGWYSFGFHSF